MLPGTGCREEHKVLPSQGEPYLPPTEISQPRLGPHAPPTLLNYQQEPAEHTAGFLPHRNNSTDYCRSPCPSAPSSLAPPNTRGYTSRAYLISPEMGTSQKATQALIWRYRRGLQGAATALLAKRATSRHHCKACTVLNITCSFSANREEKLYRDQRTILTPECCQVFDTAS